MRLRSANRGNGYNTWNVNAAGGVNNNNAPNSNRFAPDCVFKTDNSLSIGWVSVKTRHKEPNSQPIGEQQNADARYFVK